MYHYIKTKGVMTMTTASENEVRKALSLEELTRPVHPVMPRQLWSETLPGLWQGGTMDRWAGDDWAETMAHGKSISKQQFDSVYTLYADAEPVDWFVKEVRFGFWDSHRMDDFSPEGDLMDLVQMAHKDWKSGKRVLIRCQAGLNRSGITMALVMIRDGYSPAEAITLMREQRSPAVLCNPTFTRWLLNLTEEQLAIWRS